MREYTMAKPSLWHDHMELRNGGRTVGKSETFGKRGEALGRTWLKTVTTLDGEPVPADMAQDVREFRKQQDQADRVGWSLAWEDGGEEFGRFMDDKAQKTWRLDVCGKSLYWWGGKPQLGGGRFGFDDSDDQTYVSGRRDPFRTTTWQEITVVDELPEPEGIVVAQFGHTLWHTAALTWGAHGNTAFLVQRGL